MPGRVAILSPERIGELLVPFYPEASASLLQQLSVYLDLLVKWNSRTNLTAIRDPEEMVRRHFGESLFLAAHLPACHTLLDLGSGAGFPGVPIKLVWPDLIVTLAESQNKKASFLREVVRTLNLPCTVWGSRVEDMSPGSRFDCVALRAVDNPKLAVELARRHLAPDGVIAQLVTTPSAEGKIVRVPGSSNSFVQFLPRG